MNMAELCVLLDHQAPCRGEVRPDQNSNIKNNTWPFFTIVGPYGVLQWNPGPNAPHDTPLSGHMGHHWNFPLVSIPHDISTIVHIIGYVCRMFDVNIFDA